MQARRMSRDGIPLKHQSQENDGYARTSALPRWEQHVFLRSGVGLNLPAARKHAHERVHRCRRGHLGAGIGAHCRGVHCRRAAFSRAGMRVCVRHAVLCNGGSAREQPHQQHECRNVADMSANLGHLEFRYALAMVEGCATTRLMHINWRLPKRAPDSRCEFRTGSPLRQEPEHYVFVS